MKRIADFLLRNAFEPEYVGQITLAASRPTKQSFEFPKGNLYIGLNLRIAITATVGASPVGGVAFENPFLELVNQILLEVSRDGTLINAPAKPLYRLNQILYGTVPTSVETFTVNTAAAYAGTIDLFLPFADPRSLRPLDTALDSSRYNKFDLTVGIGAGADMLSTAHTSGGGVTLSALTCDVELVKIAGIIPQGAKPIGIQRIGIEYAPVDTSTDTIIRLTRSPNRFIKRLLLGAYNLAVASRPFSGDANNAILNLVSVRSDLRYHHYLRRDHMVQNHNKLTYNQGTWPTGIYVLDFVEDGSNLSALSTGDKSLLQVEFTEDSANPAGTNNLTVMSQVIETFPEAG